MTSETPWPDPLFRLLRFNAIEEDVSVRTIRMSASGVRGATEGGAVYCTSVYAEVRGMEEWHGRDWVSFTEPDALVWHAVVVAGMRARSPVEWVASFLRKFGV